MTLAPARCLSWHSGLLYNPMNDKDGKCASGSGIRMAPLGACSCPHTNWAPPYLPRRYGLVDAVCTADAIPPDSAGYHGGLVKKALDYLEALRLEDRPYFNGRSVGGVATASGRQAAVNTLTVLQQAAHVRQGWPSPNGIALNMSSGGDRSTIDALITAYEHVIIGNVVEFLGDVRNPVAPHPRAQHSSDARRPMRCRRGPRPFESNPPDVTR